MTSLSSMAEHLAHYDAARSRLLWGDRRPSRQHAHKAAPVSGAPLNMLEPCSLRFLLTLAALRHGQSVRDIRGPGRTRPVAAARHEAVWLMAFHTTHSLARIAMFLHRDHTTVHNSLRHYPPFERPTAEAMQ